MLLSALPLADQARPFFFLKRRDLGLAVLGKKIIQRLGEQILNSRVMFGREKPQLLFDLRRKVASDVAFPFPARPEMTLPRFSRRDKFSCRLSRNCAMRRACWLRATKHGFP